MKIGVRYLALFGFSFLLFIVLMGSSESPESSIQGQWKELVWEYERVDKNDTTQGDFNTVSQFVKNVVGENLIVHKAEKWIFKPNGQLILKGKNYTKEVNWSIKGRGNILEIKYDDNQYEHYNLTELSNDRLVLNFDTDTHTRGIARLTFEKI